MANLSKKDSDRWLGKYEKASFFGKCPRCRVQHRQLDVFVPVWLSLTKLGAVQAFGLYLGYILESGGFRWPALVAVGAFSGSCLLAALFLLACRHSIQIPSSRGRIIFKGGFWPFVSEAHLPLEQAKVSLERAESLKSFEEEEVDGLCCLYIQMAGRRVRLAVAPRLDLKPLSELIARFIDVAPVDSTVEKLNAGEGQTVEVEHTPLAPGFKGRLVMKSAEFALVLPAPSYLLMEAFSLATGLIFILTWNRVEWFPIVHGAVAILAGASGLAGFVLGRRRIIFDRRQGLIRFQNRRTMAMADVAALQFVPAAKQVNIIFRDGWRTNVVACSSLSKADNAARRLALFLAVPLLTAAQSANIQNNPQHELRTTATS